MYKISYICHSGLTGLNPMKTATISDFRQRIKKHLDELEADQDILLLSRPRKRGFVILPLALYQSLEETAHLLATDANAKRLAQGIKQAKQGKARAKKIRL